MPHWSAPPGGRPLQILIHARNPALWTAVQAVIAAHGPIAEVAFTVVEGQALMARGGYDRVFIGICVPRDERLAILALAAAHRASVIEITDADTVARELFRHEWSGAHPRLPPSGQAPAQP